MTDALAAILAVPPAIEASKNLIAALIGRLSRDPDKHDAHLVHEKLSEITRNVLVFTDFTENLRKWKEIHNATQLVLFSDLLRTLALLPSGREVFCDTVAREIDRIRREFEQLLRGRTGALMLINTLPPTDFEVDGLPNIIIQSGQNWGEYIKDLSNKAAAALDLRDFGTLFMDVNRLSTDCTLLNIAADKTLKEGLSEVTRVMHEVRLKTKDDVVLAAS